MHTIKELGIMAVKSGFLPTSIKTPEQAVIIMLKGRELGLAPMHAFSSIAVVDGKPTMSAELMLSLIFKNVPGAIVDYLVSDSEQCVIEAKRPNCKKAKFSFTVQDAERAKLLNKGPWITYRAAMLRARCISSMARAVFPDALSGIVYTPEELGAEINDDGEVITVTPPHAEPPTQTTTLPTPTATPASDYRLKIGKLHVGKKLSEIDLNTLHVISDHVANKPEAERSLNEIEAAMKIDTYIFELEQKEGTK